MTILLVATAVLGLLSLIPGRAQAQILLGDLVERAHNVNGRVTALSERVLEIAGFEYDGQGPAVYFWLDTNSVPSDGGQGLVSPWNEPTCEGRLSKGADGTETVLVELPPEVGSLFDYAGGSFSLWCKEFSANFGEVQIPTNLEGLPGADSVALECFSDDGSSAGGGGSPTKPPTEPPAQGPAQAEIILGDLVEHAHNVNGRVTALSERVLEIAGFEYDGQGPAVYFWLDTNSVPSDGGQGLVSPWNEPACEGRLSKGADGTETVLVELPPEVGSLSDYAGGSFSLWCKEFSANFGEVQIPTSLEGLPGADAVALECFSDDGSSAGGGGSPTKPPTEPPTQEIPAIALTPEGYNCEPLHENFHVRWQVDELTLRVELVGRIADDEYMAFGLSGSDQATEMLGADAVVADINPSDGSFRARDIYLGARSQCSAGSGVCPDGQFGFFDDVTDVVGEQDSGLTLIRYIRPLAPNNIGDTDGNGFPVDSVINPLNDTYIVWAIGPISPTNDFPNFHTIYPGSSGEDKNYKINFGRDVVDNCTPLVDPGEGVDDSVEPFDRPVLDVTEFTAHIGPSGGPRGYLAISGGRTAWGISWYLNGYIAPELKLRRGTTYRFLVNGGNDEASSSEYHPFYITDSIAGGYAGLTPLERAQETVYAGIMILEQSTDEGVTEFMPLTVGPLCMYKAGNETTAAYDNLVDYDAYFSTLDASCANDTNITEAAGLLEFTPDEDTPDTVYYHCVTHQNLGWKILIINGDGTTGMLADNGTSAAVGRVSSHLAWSMSVLLATAAVAVGL